MIGNFSTLSITPESSLGGGNEMVDNDTCSACGMPCRVPEYHPYAACLMFKQTHNSATVFSNLKAVVEYGMQAERAGVSADKAMRQILGLRGKAKVAA
jgi:hypothetical protein